MVKEVVDQRTQRRHAGFLAHVRKLLDPVCGDRRLRDVRCCEVRLVVEPTRCDR